MNTLIKGIIASAPIFALVFYYVVLQHQKMDAEMKMESLKFEREWNEFNQDFVFTTNKEKYRKRALKAEKELEKAEAMAKKKEEKISNLEKEFEKALNEKDGKETNSTKK